MLTYIGERRPKAAKSTLAGVFNKYVGSKLPSHVFAENAPFGKGHHPVGQLLLALPVHCDHLHLIHCVPHKLEPICRGKSGQQALDACASHLDPIFKDAGQARDQLYLGNPVEEEDVDLCPAGGVEGGESNIIRQDKGGQSLS